MTRQLSAGVVPRPEPVPNGSSPHTSVKSHREVVLTKSSDFKLSKSDTLTEEINAPVDPSNGQTIASRVYDTSPKKYSSNASSEVTQRSQRRDHKPERTGPVAESVVIPNKLEESKRDSDESPKEAIDAKPEAPSDPVPHPKPEQEPTPKLGIDLSLALSESPVISPLNSNDTITPVSTKTTDSESTNADSDEYLLTLQETDPSLTYEQRKRIRKLKRMQKQKQPPK